MGLLSAIGFHVSNVLGIEFGPRDQSTYNDLLRRRILYVRGKVSAARSLVSQYRAGSSSSADRDQLWAGRISPVIAEIRSGAVRLRELTADSSIRQRFGEKAAVLLTQAHAVLQSAEEVNRQWASTPAFLYDRRNASWLQRAGGVVRRGPSVESAALAVHNSIAAVVSGKTAAQRIDDEAQVERMTEEEQQRVAEQRQREQGDWGLYTAGLLGLTVVILGTGAALGYAKRKGAFKKNPARQRLARKLWRDRGGRRC